jgi:hypothetical protein
MPNSIALALARNRYEFIERTVREHGLEATRTERDDNGSIICHVEGLVPHLDFCWSLEIDDEGQAGVEFCLWYLDNPEHQETCSLYMSYAAEDETWTFGFGFEADAKYDSPKGRSMAEKAFGFKQPGERKQDEESVIVAINALLAGYAASLKKHQAKNT